MIQIIHVRREADAADVRILVREFVKWLAERYPDEQERIAGYFKAQDLEKQLRDLLMIFHPPLADCLLARLGGKAAGVVMLKPHSEGTCEMNRMFVHASARGQGVGKALVVEIVETARSLGYRRMLLAAGPRHTEAVALYQSLGFAVDANLPDTGAGDIELRMIREL